MSYATPGLAYATDAGGQWKVTSIDSSSRVYSTSIALDPGGGIHIAYTFEPANGSAPPGIRYATNVGGSWIVREIAPGSILPSIAVDPTGRVHISYFAGQYSSDATGVGYATNVGGSWNTSIVFPTLSEVRYASRIAVGPGDRVYIAAAFEAGYGGVGYLARGTGGWQFHPIDNVSAIGNELSLRVDHAGALHLAYGVESVSGTSLPANPLRYVTNRSGTWSWTNLTDIGYASPFFGNNLAMVLDEADHPHILGVGTGDSLAYATDASGLWTRSALSGVTLWDRWGAPFDLAVGRGGQVHILYSADRQTSHPLLDSTNRVNGVNVLDFLNQAAPILAAEAVGFAVVALGIPVAPRLRAVAAARAARRAEAQAKHTDLKALRRTGP